MTSYENQLLDIWRIHTRINLEILDTIDEVDFEKRLNHYETSIWGQFAHIHNVRRLWLMRVEGLADGLVEIEESSVDDRKFLRENLKSSAERVQKMLNLGTETGGELPYFQPHLGAFVGYLIAHECMHHGEIGMILGSIGKELPLEVVWNWNQI